MAVKKYHFATSPIMSVNEAVYVALMYQRLYYRGGIIGITANAVFDKNAVGIHVRADRELMAQIAPLDQWQYNLKPIDAIYHVYEYLPGIYFFVMTDKEVIPGTLIEIDSLPEAA